jgi:iron complex outermembrane receptor protein
MIHSWLPRLVLGSILLLPALPLSGQATDTVPNRPPDTTVFRVEGIRVQASRPVTTVGGASAVEATIDSLFVPPAATAEEVLRALPMLYLRTNSRGEAEVTVRGSESRQVAVLVDGVPVTLGWDARTDVSVLPVGAVTDVTVVRGLSTLLHGPNVLGGVVEMSVGRGEIYPERGSLRASLGGDDVGGFSGSATLERPFRAGRTQGVFRVGGSYRDSPGFPLPGGIAEPVTTGDDLRLNTDVSNAAGFAALRLRSDDGQWGSASFSTFSAERGIAAELGADDPRLWRYPEIRRSIIALSGGTGDRETPFGRGDLEASVGIDVGTTAIDAFDTRAYETVTGTEVGDARTLTLRLLADHTLGSRADLRSSFTFSDIRHDLSENGVVTGYGQQLMSLAGETIVRLLDGGDGAFRSVRLSVGGAWDRGRTPETGGRPSLGTIDDWGARVGLSALLADGQTLVHTGLSRRGRFPSLRESYAEALNRFLPNPDLRPERLTSLEAGVTSRIGSGELQVVGFRNRLDGAIRRITFPNPQGGPSLRQRVNADRLDATGLEVLFSQTLGAVGVGGELTLQRVELADPGGISSQPENMPEQMGSVWVDVPLPAELGIRTTVEYTGSQFCQDPNSGADVELSGATWVNASLGRTWTLSSGRSRRGGFGGRLETRISGVNLGDQLLYEQCGLPRTGRLLQFQLRVF